MSAYDYLVPPRPGALSTRRAAALAAVVLPLLAVGEARAQLRYSFDPHQVAREGLPERPTRLACRPIEPMRDMARLSTFYQADRTQSVIDREAMGRYGARTWRTAQLAKLMLPAGEAALSNGERARQGRDCILRTLRGWAEADALLGNLEDNDPAGHRQAVLIGIWTGLAAANGVASAEASGPIAAADRAPILAWLGRLSASTVSEFTRRADREQKYRWLDSVSNHRYWAAAFVGSVAALRSDRAGFDWAMAELRRALAAVPEDGALTSEMARGRRALHYQAFAALPLGLLVALADANGVGLKAEEEAALQRMVRFTATALRDPSLLERRTGHAQEVAAGQLFWIDVLLRHLGRTAPGLAAELDGLARPSRPFRSDFTGINLSATYGPR